jgi:shikimate kinase
MPGSGKSTVGRHVARHLQWAFLDTDHVIEQQIGCSIREFFELHGEAAFREVEADVIRRCMLDPGSRVVATGGGAVLREANRTALHQGGAVFYLRSAPEDLARRLRHDAHRPLLQGAADPLRRLRQLYSERDPLYRAAAHYVIEAARPSVHTLVNMVLMQLELAGLVTRPGPDGPPVAARP